MDAEVVVPVKHLSNFWRSLDFPLISYKTELDLSWPKECIIFEISITPTIAGNSNARPPVADIEVRQTTGSTFQINNAKFYVPVVRFKW